VDDPSLLGVDDGEKVGRVDARAFVEAGEVQELLLRRAHRLLRRIEEARRLMVFVLHVNSLPRPRSDRGLSGGP